jgi:multiple sugar transport system substrate-binding protein
MKRFVVLLIALCLMVTALSAKDVTLRVIQVFTSPERTKILETIADKFEEENPGVTVELISPPYETAYNKIYLMVSTEQPLDVVEVGDWSLAGMASMGKLESLESYIANSNMTEHLIDGVVKSARIYNNTAYVMPNAVYVKTLFYKPDTLAKYNIETPPTTMGELMAYSKYLTEADKAQFGFDWRGIDPVNFMDLVVTSFFDDIDPTCMYKTTDGTIIFEDERALEGLNFYLDLYYETAPKDAINWGFDDQINSFVSGVTPLLFQDPDTTGLLNSLLGVENYKTAPLPTGPGGKSYPTFGFGGWGIPNYSENKELAWKFIEFFNSPEIGAYFCKNYGALPTDKRVYEEDEYFSSETFAGWQEMFSNTEKYQFTDYPLGNPEWFSWYQLQGETQQKILLGKMTPEQALEEWADFWKDAGL